MEMVTEIVETVILDLEEQLAYDSDMDSASLTDLLVGGLENVAMALEMANMTDMVKRCERLQAQLTEPKVRTASDREQSQRQSKSILAWLKRLAGLVSQEQLNQTPEVVQALSDQSSMVPEVSVPDRLDDDLSVLSDSVVREASDNAFDTTTWPATMESRPPLTSAQSEMLQQLWVEVEDLLPELEEIQAEAGEDATAISRYVDLLQNLIQTAEFLGLKGLGHFVALLCERLLHCNVTSDDLQLLLFTWPQRLQLYLTEGASESAAIALLDYLDDDLWGGQKIELLESQQLLVGLLTLPDVDEETPAVRVWEAEDVLLGENGEIASADPNDDIWQAFLQDAPVQMAQLAQALTQLNSHLTQGESLDSLHGFLHQAQRSSHTLKGSANLLGIKGVANLSHALEDTFEGLVNDDQPLSVPLRRLLDEAIDCLSMMIDALLGLDSAPDNALDILRQVSDWRAVNQAPLIEAPTAPGRLSEEETASGDLFNASSELSVTETETNETTVPALTALPRAESEDDEEETDEMLLLAEEMSVNNVQTRELYKRIQSVGLQLKRQDNLLQARRMDLEGWVDGRSMARTHRTVEPQNEEFDPLELDRYDDLHRSTHQYFEAVADVRALNEQLQDHLDRMDRLMGQQHRFIDQLQHQLLSRQRISAETLAPRLQRCVRQAARQCDKQVVLEIAGGQLGIDRQMLEKLAPALMHLLRNAVDHGIESDIQRLESGKSPEGNIQLTFSQQGRFLNILLQDDGRGLDFDAIYRRALSRKLISPDSPRPTDADLANMIWLSGFSTRDSATHVSGRGIGMDAVKAQIEALGGQVRRIDVAQGSGFELRLPVKEITQYMLLVSVSGKRFAVPTANLQQILPRDHYPCQQIGGQRYLTYQDQLYRYEDLAECLQLSGDTDDARRAMILLHWNDQWIALAVNSLVSGEQLVQRGSGLLLPRLHGLSGLSILGDGSLVPVLNLAELLASEENSPRAGAYRAAGEREAVSESSRGVLNEELTVLVVDDSLSVRTTLKQLLQDEGYRVVTAVDGVDALEKLQDTFAAAVLVDMEMPRMDGLEFTRHLRQRPQWQALPVVMITSRSQEKHRELARKAGVSAFKTKPYQEGDLLDTLQTLLEPDLV